MIKKIIKNFRIDSFKAKDLRVFKKQQTTPVDVNKENFAFGRVPSDYMVEIKYHHQ